MRRDWEKRVERLEWWAQQLDPAPADPLTEEARQEVLDELFLRIDAGCPRPPDGVTLGDLEKAGALEPLFGSWR